ncbi:MAG: hypothetical protein P1U68_04720 [Verrucomicrobiales bacterium]|nr:hypothetical protein [Verrucomicrobiales bacterium]
MRSFTLILLLEIFPLLACGEFSAGSAIVDITPVELPIVVNGGMKSRSLEVVNRPLHARSLAFSDGEESIVIVVADSCMMPKDLIDRAKGIASKKCGIPSDRILVSATHTHTAPSCMGALGTDADPGYSLFLTRKLVEAILAPLKKMKPARIGWGEIDAGEYTALRRWVIHPDHIKEDPFGKQTVRANMHAAVNWNEVTGKSGPEDPMLSIISVQSLEGKPIGLLANFSMHFFGDRDISPDYFGLFSNGLMERIAPGNEDFVAIMSHGCSGDIWRHDYEISPDRAGNKTKIEDYTAGMIDLAMAAHDQIHYEVPDSIAMAELRMTLDYRVPDRERLAWAQRVVADMGGRLPKTKPEVYAREQLLLHEKQDTEIVIQALRLGETVSIASTPTETYAISGLKIKNASPAPHTMVIELANGGDGYIPPPEQHLLGGYNTWPARSAGLEVEAEPKIVDAAISLLEKVTAKPRTDRRPEHGPAAREILSLNPKAYWRLDEFSGPRAIDSSGFHHDAIYEPQILFYLPGPASDKFSENGVNRSAHFAGDRLSAKIPGLTGKEYTVSLWFWSGSDVSTLQEPEWIIAASHDSSSSEASERIGISMNSAGQRQLIYDGPGYTRCPLESPPIERWTWNHLALMRKHDSVHLYLNGKRVGEFDVRKDSMPVLPEIFFFGGSKRDQKHFEGRLDEIAVFDRILSDDLILELSRTGK